MNDLLIYACPLHQGLAFYANRQNDTLCHLYLHWRSSLAEWRRQALWSLTDLSSDTWLCKMVTLDKFSTISDLSFLIYKTVIIIAAARIFQ